MPVVNVKWKNVYPDELNVGDVLKFTNFMVDWIKQDVKLFDTEYYYSILIASNIYIVGDTLIVHLDIKDEIKDYVAFKFSVKSLNTNKKNIKYAFKRKVK